MTPPRKKLLVFCPLYPPSTGGLQNHAEQFNQEMVKKGYSILVFTPHLYPRRAPTRDDVGGHVHILRFPAVEIIPNYPIPALWTITFWRMWADAHAFSADILLSRTRFFSTSLLALAAKILWSKPLLHVEHGSDFPQFDRSPVGVLSRVYDNTLGRLVLRSATNVVAVSQAGATFVRNLSSRDAVVIYRGVDVEGIQAAQPATLSNYKIANSNTVLLYAGRLISGKGVADLLAAFSDLESPGVHLLIVGEGPERSALEQQASGDRRVHFLGAKTPTQTWQLMKAADVFVNPSYTEGLPTAVLEAQLSDCHVIATDVGGTREIHGVTLIPPRSPEALQDAIQKYLNAPQTIQGTKDRNYTNLSTKFSWDTARDAYVKLFTQLSNK